MRFLGQGGSISPSYLSLITHSTTSAVGCLFGTVGIVVINGAMGGLVAYGAVTGLVTELWEKMVPWLLSCTEP